MPDDIWNEANTESRTFYCRPSLSVGLAAEHWNLRLWAENFTDTRTTPSTSCRWAAASHKKPFRATSAPPCVSIKKSAAAGRVAALCFQTEKTIGRRSSRCARSAAAYVDAGAQILRIGTDGHTHAGKIEHFTFSVVVCLDGDVGGVARLREDGQRREPVVGNHRILLYHLTLGRIAAGDVDGVGELMEERHIEFARHGMHSERTAVDMPVAVELVEINEQLGCARVDIET